MKFYKIEVIKILAIAFISALIFNAFSANRIDYIYSPEQVGDKETVSLEQAKKLFDEKEVTFLDARPMPIYKRGHIPGAISVPYNSPEKKELMADILKDESLVVYCYSARCNQARILKQNIEKLGYTNVVLFDGGIKEWTKANYPMEKSEDK